LTKQNVKGNLKGRHERPFYLVAPAGGAAALSVSTAPPTDLAGNIGDLKS
jgi:hypothetical protein